LAPPYSKSAKARRILHRDRFLVQASRRDMGPSRPPVNRLTPEARRLHIDLFGYSGDKRHLTNLEMSALHPYTLRLTGRGE
jgi:hypothetical protein